DEQGERQGRGLGRDGVIVKVGDRCLASGFHAGSPGRRRSQPGVMAGGVTLSSSLPSTVRSRPLMVMPSEAITTWAWPHLNVIFRAASRSILARVSLPSASALRP